MLLIVLTGDMFADVYEFRLLLARDEADDDRRKEVRRWRGEKRAVMAWKRADCILKDLSREAREVVELVVVSDAQINSRYSLVVNRRASYMVLRARGGVTRRIRLDSKEAQPGSYSCVYAGCRSE